MKEKKKRNVIARVLIIQLLVFIWLLSIDLYVFKGFYTSKVTIAPDVWGNSKSYSCKLKIEKKTDNKYLFTFTNNSIIPQYFINYRNGQHFQNVTDSLFFNYLDRNLFPAYHVGYSLNFDCGTGLGYTSINPLESYEIEKNYEDIIKECSTFDILKKTDFIYEKSKKKYLELKSNYLEIDSLIRDESQLVLATDSLEVEYYIMTYSFVSKNQMYTLSNRIKVSIKDLLEQYKKKDR